MGEPKPFASLSSGLLARKGAAKPAMRPQGFGQIGAAGIEDLGWNDMGYAAAPSAPHELPDDLPEHVPSSIAALTPAPRPGDHAQPEAFEADDWDEGEDEEFAPPPVVEQQRAIAASFAPPAPVETPEPEEELPEPIVEAYVPEIEISEPDTARRALEPEISEPVAEAPAPEPEFYMPEPEAPAPVVVERKPKVQAIPAFVEPAPRESTRASKAKAAFTLRLDADRHLKLRLACAVTHRSAQQIVSDALDEFLRLLPELDAMANAMPAQPDRNREDPR